MLAGKLTLKLLHYSSDCYQSLRNVSWVHQKLLCASESRYHWCCLFKVKKRLLDCFFGQNETLTCTSLANPTAPISCICLESRSSEAMKEVAQIYKYNCNFHAEMYTLTNRHSIRVDSACGYTEFKMRG